MWKIQGERGKYEWESVCVQGAQRQALQGILFFCSISFFLFGCWENWKQKERWQIWFFFFFFVNNNRYVKEIKCLFVFGFLSSNKMFAFLKYKSNVSRFSKNDLFLRKSLPSRFCRHATKSDICITHMFMLLKSEITPRENYKNHSRTFIVFQFIPKLISEATSTLIYVQIWRRNFSFFLF